MHWIAKRALWTATICATVLVISLAERPSAAHAQENRARVCSPAVVNDKDIPDSGQYEHDCRMAAATCAAFGAVGTYGADQGGMNNGFARCFRKAIADDEQQYEAWLRSAHRTRITIISAQYLGPEYGGDISINVCDATQKVAEWCRDGAPCSVPVTTDMCRIPHPMPGDGNLGIDYKCGDSPEVHSTGAWTDRTARLECN